MLKPRHPFCFVSLQHYTCTHTFTVDERRCISLPYCTIITKKLYACETWATTKGEEQRLATAQRAMEEAMLGLSLRDRVQNEEVQARTGVKDAIAEYNDSKFHCAGRTVIAQILS